MPFLLQQEVYRPAPKPVEDLPFGVRSAGHYRIRPPFVSPGKIISFTQLFWCARGSGALEFAGKERALKTGQVALYYPGMRHFWHAGCGDWEFYWMTLDGPFAGSIPAAFGLDAAVYDAGMPPADLFRRLLKLTGEAARQAELRACAAAFAILTRAAGSHADQSDGLVAAAVRQMHKQFNLPDLNVKTLIAELGVGRAAFTGRFHAAMGMTPGAYLERLRLQSALSLLKQRRLPVAEVALLCGFTDANYFSRVVRRTTGFSPLQFRKHYLSEQIGGNSPARQRPR